MRISEREAPIMTEVASPTMTLSHPNALDPVLPSVSRGLLADPTTLPNGTTIVPGYCEYSATGDMYGLGVRLGFYVQSACTIIACVILPRGGRDNRANSIILSFALTVAFFIGIRDRTNQMVLEVQLFIPLVTMICLPLLSLSVVQWRRNSQETVRANVPNFVLAIAFLTSSVLAVFGEVHGRYYGPCKLFSGLGGTSVKATRGWAVWVTLLSSLTLIALVLLLICAAKVYRSTPSSRRLHCSLSPQSWIHSGQKICLCWTLISCGLWATCVASVELTIRRHEMTTPKLTDNDFGQWISLCVGIGAVFSLIWTIIGENGRVTVSNTEDEGNEERSDAVDNEDGGAQVGGSEEGSDEEGDGEESGGEGGGREECSREEVDGAEERSSHGERGNEENGEGKEEGREDGGEEDERDVDNGEKGGRDTAM